MHSIATTDWYSAGKVRDLKEISTSWGGSCMMLKFYLGQSYECSSAGNWQHAVHIEHIKKVKLTFIFGRFQKEAQEAAFGGFAK